MLGPLRKALRFWLVPLAALALGVTAKPVFSQTLKSELTGLLASHPQIQAVESDTFAADESINESFAAFFPTLAISADGGYEIVDSPGRRATAGKASREVRDSEAITVNWNLFEGFRKYADLDRTRFQKDAADLFFEATRQNVLMQGIAA